MTIGSVGGNVCFTPRNQFAPATEAEVLEILDRRAQCIVRAVGALRSWSPIVACEDSGAERPYYAISFISYVAPHDRFLVRASFLPRSITRLFQAQLHWGRNFPLSTLDIESVYLHLPEFRALCRQVDPNGVFRQDFTERVI